MRISQIWKNKKMGNGVGSEGLRSRVCGEREREGEREKEKMDFCARGIKGVR